MNTCVQRLEEVREMELFFPLTYHHLILWKKNKKSDPPSVGISVLNVPGYVIFCDTKSK